MGHITAEGWAVTTIHPCVPSPLATVQRSFCFDSLRGRGLHTLCARMGGLDGAIPLPGPPSPASEQNNNANRSGSHCKRNHCNSLVSPQETALWA